MELWNLAEFYIASEMLNKLNSVEYLICIPFSEDSWKIDALVRLIRQRVCAHIGYWCRFECSQALSHDTNKHVFPRSLFHSGYIYTYIYDVMRSLFYEYEKNRCNSFRRRRWQMARSMKFLDLFCFRIFKWNVCICLGIKFTDSGRESENKLHRTDGGSHLKLEK